MYKVLISKKVWIDDDGTVYGVGCENFSGWQTKVLNTIENLTWEQACKIRNDYKGDNDINIVDGHVETKKGLGRKNTYDSWGTNY